MEFLIERRADKALRQNEAKFRSVAEKTDAIIFIVRDKQICYVNPAAETITGYSKEELLTNCDLLRQLELDGYTKAYKQHDSASPQQRELKILSKDGEERWLDYSVEELEFEGKPACLVTAFDITKRKQAEAEIRRALEQEKEIGEHRAQFISMVSHEFRTPLHVISFSTSLLRRHRHHWSEEKILKYFYRLETAVEKLTQLMDEVLIVGRAEAGKLKFEPKPINLLQFCRDIIEEMHLSESSQHAINFVSQCDRSSVNLDKKLLQPILKNLLDNAVKYSSPNSKIDFVLSCQDEKVIFQIKDRGIGIPAADLQRLFEPFHRGGNVGDLPGNGLGLAIVKKLVGIHGGQISVKSKVEEGTIFTITLPLIQPVAGEATL